MLYAILFFLVGLLIFIPFLRLILPNFERQKMHSDMASIFTKTEDDLKLQKQGHLVGAIVRGAAVKKLIDIVSGTSLRNMYSTLGKGESFELHFIKLIFSSVLLGMLPVILYLFKTEPLLLLMSPLLIGLIFLLGIQRIIKDYKKRQRLLIRDLPRLIDKMISALEVGKPLIDIFTEAAQQKDSTISHLIKRLIANTNQMPLEDALYLFAEQVDIPVFYDFVSIVNISMSHGFREAEDDLASISVDLQELNRLSIIEQTNANPGKMNIYYVVLLGHVAVLLISCMAKIFAQLTQL